jgi:subtilisin family serine protease
LKKIFLFIFITFVSLYSQDICFQNFDKQTCGNFKVLDEVIIKSELSKIELSRKLNSKIKQITNFKKFNFYLKTSSEPIAEAVKLTQKSFIEYAQPNVSQKRVKNISRNRVFSKIRFKGSKEELFVKKLWQKTKGQNIKVAIIDDGFDLKHPDLQDIKIKFQFDVDKRVLDASPKLKLDKHGTQVLGVIKKIAPEFELIAIRQTTNITSDTILAFTTAQLSSADIINCSWNSPILLEPIYDVIREISKNIFVVFSAGNSRKKIEPLSIEASIPEVVTVGANAKFSNFGKAVDIYLPSYILTTNINKSYNYFNGTSASAPIFTGILALLLSENRDFKIDEVLKKLKGD